MDHVELESALWESVAAGVKALEHTAQAVDYRTLCEGLARLNRIVRSLLHRAAYSAGQARQHQHQSGGQVSAPGGAGGGEIRVVSCADGLGCAGGCFVGQAVILACFCWDRCRCCCRCSVVLIVCLPLSLNLHASPTYAPAARALCRRNCCPFLFSFELSSRTERGRGFWIGICARGGSALLL